VLLASFDDRVAIHFDLGASRSALGQAVATLSGGDGSRLYDALQLVIDGRLRAVEGRKAVVLFTDGVDTRSRLSDAERVLRAADGADVVIYVIRFPVSPDAGALWFTRSPRFQRLLVAPDDALPKALPPNPAPYLDRLCAQTGGRCYTIDDAAELQSALQRIATELSRQYTLHYYSSNKRLDGTYRTITVTVDHPGAVVRARPGYEAPSVR
jgi:Ca-activated chloride channel homolog